MNFTVTSQGLQFDRLGLMFLGDIEVFRTSTSEPTANGIVWTYMKEMDQYNALWRDEQEIVFDLPNIVNSEYTGPLYTTLTATFSETTSEGITADEILPISRTAADNRKSFQIPDDGAAVKTHSIPQNVERAVVALSACGQQAEEFWYQNVLNSDTETFADSPVGVLGGSSPFREVQLFIDGTLAGVVWPFPVIFTGGIVPGLWRPIAGIDAYDLRQNEIDITPWLGALRDGQPHEFEIRVAGLTKDGDEVATLSSTVGSYWVVTGSIFLFYGKEGAIPKRDQPTVNDSPPVISVSSFITKDSKGANDTLSYLTSVKRTFSVSVVVETGLSAFPAYWEQDITYHHKGLLTSKGLSQTIQLTTDGLDVSSSGYTHGYSYPLNVTNAFALFPDGGFSIGGSIDRSLKYNVSGPSVFPNSVQSFGLRGKPSIGAVELRDDSPELLKPLSDLSGAKVATAQTGVASYIRNGTTRSGTGSTTQDFTFNGVEQRPLGTIRELYSRHVKAVRGVLVEDKEKLMGTVAPKLRPSQNIAVSGPPVFDSAALEDGNIRAILGRGPG